MNKKLLAFLFISTLAFAAAKKKAVVEEQLEETKNKGKQHKQFFHSTQGVPLSGSSYSYSSGSIPVGSTVISGGVPSGQVIPSIGGAVLQEQVSGSFEPSVIITGSNVPSNNFGGQIISGGQQVVGGTVVESIPMGGTVIDGGVVSGGVVSGPHYTGGQVISGGQLISGGQVVGGQVIQEQVVGGQYMSGAHVVGGQVIHGGQTIVQQSHPPGVVYGETLVTQPNIVTYEAAPQVTYSQPVVSEVIYTENAVTTPGQVVVEEYQAPNQVVYTETVEQAYQPAQHVSAQVINERMQAQYPQGTSTADYYQAPYQDEIYHETVHVEAGGLDTIYIVLIVLFALCLLSLCLGALLYFLCNKKSRYQGEEEYHGGYQDLYEVEYKKSPKTVRTHEVINAYTNPVQVQGDALSVQKSLVQQNTLIPTQRQVAVSQPVQVTGQQIVTSPVHNIGATNLVGGVTNGGIVQTNGVVPVQQNGVIGGRWF